MASEGSNTSGYEYAASAPSNIALIKYWGKQDAKKQIPANDSISLTLSTASSVTTAQITNRATHEVFYGSHQLFETDPFAKKIFSHLKFLCQTTGVQKKLRIETENNFPDRCGIASSASGFAALTIASCAALTGSGDFDSLARAGYNRQTLADLARQGSGSSCRSLFPGIVHWKTQTAENAQQEVSSIFPAEHWALANIIVLVSTKPKATSSSQAHEAAWSSPLFRQRVAAIPERCQLLKTAIAQKDLSQLGAIIEAEATEMHAVMMTSRPSAQYFEEDTAQVLAWVREQRLDGFLPAYFTMDAGPNVHLICEQQNVETIATKIAERFPELELLIDKIGNGPTLTMKSSEELS